MSTRNKRSKTIVRSNGAYRDLVAHLLGQRKFLHVSVSSLGNKDVNGRAFRGVHLAAQRLCGQIKSARLRFVHLNQRSHSSDLQLELLGADNLKRSEGALPHNACRQEKIKSKKGSVSQPNRTCALRHHLSHRNKGLHTSGLTRVDGNRLALSNNLDNTSLAGLDVDRLLGVSDSHLHGFRVGGGKLLNHPAICDKTK